MITFATHYQALDEKAEPFRPINFSLIHLMFESVSLFHPNCRKVLLTDRKTHFEEETFEIIRYPIDNYPLRYAETVAQAQFLKSHPENGNLIFLDFDILVQANLESVFENTEDIFLTLRPSPIIPINLGVTFVKRGSFQKAFKFFNQILAKMLLQNNRLMNWGGSQKAIWGLLQPSIVRMDKDKDSITLDSLNIKFLKGDIYNYSSETVEEMEKHHPDKKILHFKGHLKEAMPIYFDKYLKK
ncbi:hypothetical protein [Criblamydia sequanensis]|uniref:Nucleotide-diphospho-sugar transferase domain-containing protein n=1 Tax=Candidatus Criblamydia sequanensis CRIB-18 TaxID=1437425 RepID=A0A090D000_9BACT|nr:hypothetical protein [Criblamydia sequanensis]CDR34762.1 Conserved hypothetical protein [Criblamydia sequanensis CRIB-18]